MTLEDYWLTIEALWVIGWLIGVYVEVATAYKQKELLKVEWSIGTSLARNILYFIKNFFLWIPTLLSIPTLKKKGLL